MKHLAAYLLLTLGGNSKPSAEDVKAVLNSVGIEADDDRLNKLISELSEKDLNSVIAEGNTKLSSVPSGGGGGGGGGGATTTASGGGGAAPEAPKEEEKKEEKEESDEDMGFGLFD